MAWFENSNNRSLFYDLNSALPFELVETVRAITPQNLRTHERDAKLHKGHLDDVALRIATNLQTALTDVIGALPEPLRRIPAVELYPCATYAQTLRVRDLLNDSV